MAYDRQFYRVSWLWTMADEEEIAQTSVHVAGSAPGDPVSDPTSVTDADMDDLFDLMADLWDPASALKIADYGNLVGVKLAAVGTDGHYLFGPRLKAHSIISGAGTDVPPQVSAVLTLRSADTLSSGRGNYGRMYLPYCQIPTGANARASTAQRDILAAAGAAFVGGVNDWFAANITGFQVSNMSDLSSGTTKAVTRVGAGRVNDTQRRRRNALNEELAYSAV